MTKVQAKTAIAAVNDLFSTSPDGLREIVRAVMQEMLEAEMTDALGAEKGERTAARLGYRSGYYTRTLVTRVGKLELRVPQDRDGQFSTELFERYQRSEQALVATLAEMYVQGVSSRKVKAITEELCGHAFSASAVSAINKRLDGSLDAFAKRPLAEPFPYLILDARYEKVREGGVVTSQAVLIAVGIDWDGRRQILAVEMANRESGSSWKDFLLGLRRRGLDGVEFVVADDHAGLRAAIREVLPEAAVQRCYVHFLRNALDHLPRKADDDCLQELRWLYDRRNVEEARRDLSAWIAKWGARYQKLVDGVEETIEDTFTFYRLPRQHHKHLKSTNMLERLNEEIKRRTHVVRIFPNAQACQRLVRASCRNPRELARSPPLPQHERPQGAQENPPPNRDARNLADAGRTPAAPDSHRPTPAASGHGRVGGHGSTGDSTTGGAGGGGAGEAGVQVTDRAPARFGRGPGDSEPDNRRRWRRHRRFWVHPHANAGNADRGRASGTDCPQSMEAQVVAQVVQQRLRGAESTPSGVASGTTGAPSESDHSTISAKYCFIARNGSSEVGPIPPYGTKAVPTTQFRFSDSCRKTHHARSFSLLA